MREVGIFRPPGTQAHHIVGSAFESGKEAQKILRDYNIDLNSPINGVFLTGCSSSMRGTIHCGSHTKIYADLVLERIESASSIGATHAERRGSILRELHKLREELLSGEIVLNHRGRNR